MLTKRRYYENSHLSEFDAHVLFCEQQDKLWAVTLDETAFYPEGGGQPGDTGFLNDIRVADTKLRGDEIVHLCDASLPVGSTVHGTLDWARRFSFMQQHSGEHILSGLLHRDFGCDNVGFHMGADFVTIDFNVPLSDADLRRIEAEANEIIWQNRPVEVTYPTAEELPTIPYRSKKALTGQVRIVTIPGADICACCGTHVECTGEIGLIKIFSCVKFHDGVRLEILCGQKALNYLSEVTEQNRRISGLLSAKPLETAAAVERVLQDFADTKLRLASLEEQAMAAKAEFYRGAGDVLIFESAMQPDSLRKLTDCILHTCGGRAAVFAGSDADGYKYAIGMIDNDLRDFCKALNTTLQGRGGGKPNFVQGSVGSSRAAIEAFFEEAGV